jgi:pimeloyl-ACP methyl ester carboxylesterase
MKIFGISGLGADQRVFSLLNQYLNIPVTYVPWIRPLENESIEKYSKRLAEEIEAGENRILIGVSLGGMVAVEVSKHLKFEKIIIISSAGEASELPKSLVVMGMTKLLEFVPASMIVPPASIIGWFFGVKSNQYKSLLNEIILDTDKAFAKWAINQIPKWNNKIIPHNLIRIHGDNDKVLPVKSGINYRMIKNAGHFAVVENAKEIAQIINEEIDSLDPASG